jgi:hypothetical protein
MQRGRKIIKWSAVTRRRTPSAQSEVVGRRLYSSDESYLSATA